MPGRNNHCDRATNDIYLIIITLRVGRNQWQRLWEFTPSGCETCYSRSDAIQARHNLSRTFFMRLLFLSHAKRAKRTMKIVEFNVELRLEGRLSWITLRRYCKFCAPDRPLFHPIFFFGGGQGSSSCTRAPMLGSMWADALSYSAVFGREIIFEVFQPMWSRYLNVTDRQTTYCRITVLCVASRGNDEHDIVWNKNLLNANTGNGEKFANFSELTWSMIILSVLEKVEFESSFVLWIT